MITWSFYLPLYMGCAIIVLDLGSRKPAWLLPPDLFDFCLDISWHLRFHIAYTRTSKD